MKIIQFFINGDKVSEDVFERDMNDNFNCGIDYTLVLKGYSLYMRYEDE